MSQLPEPVASRPYMPGYGILPAGAGSGLLPWSWADARLSASHDYWLATVGPDGRPHVTPVWGVWREGTVWVSTSPGSRKARDLAANPKVSITTDDPREPVVVDGEAERVTISPDATADVEAFTAAMNDKYEPDYSVDFFASNACFRIRPRTVFGLVESDFLGSPTRWTFPQQATAS
jgi:PPOX class probable F420-dependent enzyme